MVNSVQPETYSVSTFCYKDKPVKIYIEGPDGSGKTVLAGQLYNMLNEFVIRVPKNTHNVICTFKYMAQDISNYKDCEYIIFDRSYITELVYRLEDNKQIEQMHITNVADDLSDTIIIYCTNKNYYNNSVNRGEGETNVNNKRAKRIAKIYDIVMNLISKFVDTNVIYYDYENMTVEDLICKIQNISSNEKVVQ